MDLNLWSDKDNNTGDWFLKEDPYVAVPYLTVIIVVMFCGSIGNVLVVTAILKNKFLRTEGNFFIVNLALADLCVTFCVDPFSIVGALKGQEWFNRRFILCRSVAYICLTSCFCSLLNIGAISFNRYIYICHHVWYRRIYTLSKSLLICLTLWVACVLFALPNFIGWGGHVFDQKTLTCIWDRTVDFSFTVFIFGGVTFPIVLISICYLLIFRHVRQSNIRVNAYPGTGSNTKESKMSRSRKNSVKLVRTLFIIFVVFVICWTPYALVIVSDFKDRFTHEVHLFVTMLAHANSSFNCALYGLTNKQFRRGYRRVLGIGRCGCRCGRHGREEQLGHGGKSDMSAMTGTHYSRSGLKKSKTDGTNQ